MRTFKKTFWNVPDIRTFNGITLNLHKTWAHSRYPFFNVTFVHCTKYKSDFVKFFFVWKNAHTFASQKGRPFSVTSSLSTSFIQKKIFSWEMRSWNLLKREGMLCRREVHKMFHTVCECETLHEKVETWKTRCMCLAWHVLHLLLLEVVLDIFWVTHLT